MLVIRGAAVRLEEGTMAPLAKMIQQHDRDAPRRGVAALRLGLASPTLLVLALASLVALLVGCGGGEASKAGAVAADAPGRDIAFSLGAPPHQDVYVVNADGSGLQRLTTSAAGEFDPTWSPDGRLIAYRRETPAGQPDVVVMNADGSRKRNLTRLSGGGISPAWSPDGRRIAFASVRSGSLTELWVMKPDGTGQRRVGRVNGEYPDWSPDGEQIVFDHLTFATSDWDIWVINANGSDATPLIAWRGSNEQGASWSPDGAWIAFQSDRGSSDGLPHVWIARADGSNARRLTSRVGERPSWSPDGTRVLFTADRLLVASRDGGRLREVAVASPGSVAAADWGR
jgi:Tol biopolymer transport system component